MTNKNIENNIKKLSPILFDVEKDNRIIYNEILKTLKPAELNGKVYNPSFTDEYITAVCGYKRNIKKKLMIIKKVALYLAFCTWKRTYKTNNGSFITLQLLNDVIGVDVPNRMAMSRLIKDLEKCGAIICCNKAYKFSNAESFSRMYHINRLFIIEGQELSKNNKSMNLIKDTPYKFNIKQPIGENFPFNMIRFNDKESFALDRKCLIKKLEEFTFGTAKDFKEKLDFINYNEKNLNKKQMYFNYDFQKGFNGRAYSLYIATHREEKENGTYVQTDRTLWRKINKLNYKYDIKGAVPRCLYLFKYGKWLESSIDPYKMIWDEYVKITKTTGSFDRKLVKNTFMRCTFPKSKKLAVAQFNRAAQKASGNEFEYDTTLTQNVSKFADAMWEAIEIVCGHKNVKNVFYIESYIELLVCAAIKRQGISCYNIYDEFYYSSKVDIQKEIEKAAYEVYNKFLSFKN